jgi:hypothetical protein
MNKSLFLFCIFICITSTVFAVDRKALFQNSALEAGISVSTNTTTLCPSASVTKWWRVGHEKSHLAIGAGARFTSLLGLTHSDFSTSPAYLTKDKTGPAAFWSPVISANIDTLRVFRSQVNCMNVYLALRYEINSSFAVAYNFDVTGFSFGRTSASELTYGEASNGVRRGNAIPVPFNLRLFGDHNRGTLLSEFLVQYRIRNTIRLNAGLAVLHTENEFDDPVLYTNASDYVVNTSFYRLRSAMFSLGVNFQISKQKK